MYIYIFVLNLQIIQEKIVLAFPPKTDTETNIREVAQFF